VLASGDVNRVYERFGKQAQFLMVYLREAHAIDGWRKPNSQLEDPRTQAERNLACAGCRKDLQFEFPAVVDGMDDQTAVDWAAWPERIFVVGVDGRVAYAGEQGPWGYWPTDDVKRQAAKKTATRKKKAGPGEDPDVAARNFSGESLERFLARTVGSRPQPEVVEPRGTQALPGTETRRGTPPSRSN
jgi:hypothetical protein